MAGEVTVRGGWQVKDYGARGHGLSVLPTMADTGEVDLRRFLRTLYRGKWILILTMVASMGATVYWLGQATRLYTADVLIVVEARPSSIVKVEEAVQDISGDTARAKVNTEVAILESRGLAARVISELGLDDDPEFEPAPPLFGFVVAGADALSGTAAAEASTGGVLGAARELLSTVGAAFESARSLLTRAWAGDGGRAGQQSETGEEEEQDLTPPPEAREAAARLSEFLERLTVEPDEDSRLIRIGFTSRNPSKAALIANKIVEEYLESQLETKSEGARRAAEWLEVRLAELGHTVRTLEQDVQTQRAETGSNGIDIMTQRLAQLNTQLVQAQAASAAAGARYQQVRSVLEGHGNLAALPAVIASETIQSLRAKHAELSARLSEFRTIYGEKHPQIISVRAEVDQIERRLSRETNNILSGLRNELEAAEMHEAALRRQLEEVSQEMLELDQAEASIGQMAQRLRANQDLYQNLLKRYTEAVALRDNQQPDARIVSPAQIPLSPSYPKFPRVIALSFVGSASLAVFLVVIVERLRQRLDTVEDVERQVGLQVIGAIPDLPRLQRLASAPGDYIQREPLSEFGGAFQRLRALLTLSNNRVMPRTVLVTSGSAGEGKTTIAVCLGIASVSSGQRVLLVDCDFARPHVHRMVDVKNDLGLTDILRGTAPLEATIRQAAGYRLSILTIGHSREGAIDLLNSERMEQLLAQLKESFDIIILDSAPVLEVSNALILGSLAEKTILVTRRDWTTHRNASYAATQLQLYGADIAGIVFNRVGPGANYPV